MILITGASGFVGRYLMQTLPGAVAAPSLKEADRETVERILGDFPGDTILHTAAISDIGACRADPEGSYRANVQLPLWIAQGAAGRKLICFSSDQVYSGSPEAGPYTEDRTAPGNLYAAQKLEMEQRVLDVLPESVMLRAEWMYDFPAPKPNYLLNVLRAETALSFSPRQYRGVTYVKEVARNMERVMALPGGAYNFGSETRQSMYEITRQMVQLLGRQIPVTPGPDRHNLWMDCGKAARQGVVFRDVLEGLTLCLADYGLLPQHREN